MKHCGTKTLETDRLVLRAFCKDDYKAAFRNWTYDERVTEFLTWPAHPDELSTEKVINLWVDNCRKADFYHWAIVLKEINEPIGTISVVSKDEAVESVSVGYCIGVDWWHLGIMSEAFTAVIDFLFTEVEVNRIEARHDRNNPHSGGVMKKCGLKYEGTLRQAGANNRGIVDVCVYGILKKEWAEENNMASN